MDVPDINASGAALLDALQSAVRGKEERPEPGFFTAAQWASKTRKSLSHTLALLSSATKAGRMERKKFATFNGRRLLPTPYYRLQTS